MDYKKYIAGKINIVGASAEEIVSYITVPPAGDMGDFALPCFRFAKILRKPPAADCGRCEKFVRNRFRRVRRFGGERVSQF